MFTSVLNDYCLKYSGRIKSYTLCVHTVVKELDGTWTKLKKTYLICCHVRTGYIIILCYER